MNRPAGSTTREVGRRFTLLSVVTLAATVATLWGFNFVVIDWVGFVELIDAIGGIDVPDIGAEQHPIAQRQAARRFEAMRNR